MSCEQVSPVAVEQVNRHPRFKYFSEAGEEPYQSFLGVPLIDRGVLQVYSWCRRSRRASFGKTRFACWFKPPGKWRRLSARRVRWIASSLQHKSGFGPWRAIYGGAGIMIPPACTLVAAQSESHLSSCGNSVCRHRTERADTAFNRVKKSERTSRLSRAIHAAKSRMSCSTSTCRRTR